MYFAIAFSDFIVSFGVYKVNQPFLESFSIVGWIPSEKTKKHPSGAKSREFTIWKMHPFSDANENRYELPPLWKGGDYGNIRCIWFFHTDRLLYKNLVAWLWLQYSICGCFCQERRIHYKIYSEAFGLLWKFSLLFWILCWKKAVLVVY